MTKTPIQIAEDASKVSLIKAAPKKPSKLKGIDPESATPSKPKILIFGKPGVGKTWISLDFPNVYFIDSEGGANLEHYTDKLKKSGGKYFGVEQGSQNFEEVIDQIKALATEDHPYKTVVIDSISQLMLLYTASQSEKMMREGKDMTKTYGAEKKPAVAYMRQLVNWLERLDMNVILVAHEKAEWENEKQIGVTFDAWEKLEYILHLALNIKKIGANHKAFVRKTRLLEFPSGASFDWSYEEFAKRYGKSIMETAPKQIILASAEQMAELKNLLEVVKLAEGEQEKWFAKAKVSAFDEMDADTVSKIVVYLKAKTKI